MHFVPVCFAVMLSLHVVQCLKSIYIPIHSLHVLFACALCLFSDVCHVMCVLLHLAEAWAANDVPACVQEEQRELAKTIRVSGSILLSTVSNFLDFFKMEAGKQLDVVRTEITTKVMLGLLPASDSPLFFLLIKQKKRFSDDAFVASFQLAVALVGALCCLQTLVSISIEC